MMDDHVCPFCTEPDFDLIGLKDHLIYSCDEFSCTPSIAQDKALRQAKQEEKC